MLSDQDGKVIRLYGVMKEDGAGAKRSVFVLDTTGKIVHVNAKYDVSIPMHYKEILDALRAAQ